MDYLPYLIAAYAVFAGVLLVDFIAGHLAVRRALAASAARARPARTAAPATAGELER